MVWLLTCMGTALTSFFMVVHSLLQVACSLTSLSNSSVASLMPRPFSSPGVQAFPAKLGRNLSNITGVQFRFALIRYDSTSSARQAPKRPSTELPATHLLEVMSERRMSLLASKPISVSETMVSCSMSV